MRKCLKLFTAAVVVWCGSLNGLIPASAQTADSGSSVTEVSRNESDVPEGKKRATQEPVFRVAKLNPDAVPQSAQPSEDRGYQAAETVSADATSDAGLVAAAAKSAPRPSSSRPVRTASIANSVNADSVNPVSGSVVKSASITNALASSKPVSNASQTPAMLVSSVTPSTSLAPHPLDRAIDMAKDGLTHIQSNVRDYSAIMVKRERIDGVLGCPEYMKMKIRCPRTVSGQDVPFSVYLKTLKPRQAAGREVVWVQGQNGDKLCAHETGLLGMKRFYLEPTGWVAMQNSRYPIFDAGIENLIIKLIEKANFAKQNGHSVVNYRDNAEIMKRKCFLIELINEQQREGDEFHKAHVFIDKELNLPVRYVAYDWPATPDGKPEVIEEYTYVKINVNQGYTDIDFSPDNPDYKFPRR